MKLPKIIMNKRTIICSYKLYEMLKDKNYPNRILELSWYCEQDSFYYFSAKGHVRRVNLDTMTISECDYERGPPYMRVIRKVTQK